jgi:hypothetical protein
MGHIAVRDVGAADRLADHMRAQVHRPHGQQPAAELAERRAHPAQDHRMIIVCHR